MSIGCSAFTLGRLYIAHIDNSLHEAKVLIVSPDSWLKRSLELLVKVVEFSRDVWRQLIVLIDGDLLEMIRLGRRILYLCGCCQAHGDGISDAKCLSKVVILGDNYKR